MVFEHFMRLTSTGSCVSRRHSAGINVSDEGLGQNNIEGPGEALFPFRQS